MAIELDDGTIIRSLPEQVTKNKEDVEDLQDGLTALEQQVASALAGVFHYKGSVATYSDLPSSGNEVGDVYNVNDTGKNYAWSGSAWDDLGGIVDLSNLVTLNTSQTITGYKTFQSQLDVINGIGVGQGGVITDLQGGIRFSEYNGVNLDYENAALFPAITSTVDLGSSTNKFKDFYLSGKGYLENIDFSSELKFYINGTNRFILSAVYFTPTNDGVRDLGTSSAKWKDLYLGGSIYLGTSRLYKGGSILYTPLSFSPDNSSSDLGSSAFKWKDLYLSNQIRLYGDGTHYWDILADNTYSQIRLKYDGSEKYVITNWQFRPTTTNQLDLGAFSYAWKDLYLSGNLTDGTNSVNIADLKALIDYAKAQGWIS